MREAAAALAAPLRMDAEEEEREVEEEEEEEEAEEEEEEVECSCVVKHMSSCRVGRAGGVGALKNKNGPKLGGKTDELLRRRSKGRS